MAAKKPQPRLRYPKNTIDGSQDFIQFSIFNYKRSSKDIKILKGEEPSNIDQSDPTLSKYNSFSEEIISNTTLIGEAAKGEFKGSIILPIPSQLSDTNATNFGESNLNSFYAAAISKTLRITDSLSATEFVKNVGSMAVSAAKVASDPRVAGIIKLFTAQQAVSALGANISLEQLITRTTGSTINPNMELLFNGPTLRQFKFQFKFTPRNNPEAEDIKEIIKTFKKHMAPSGKDTNFLKTPDIFELSYIGKASDYLNRFKLCALTNMSVNYTGEGNYATYSDGAPVSMIMDLAFQELSPVYAEDYKNVGGVGY